MARLMSSRAVLESARGLGNGSKNSSYSQLQASAKKKILGSRLQDQRKIPVGSYSNFDFMKSEKDSKNRSSAQGGHGKTKFWGRIAHFVGNHTKKFHSPGPYPAVATRPQSAKMAQKGGDLAIFKSGSTLDFHNI
jgi:hypothetical protein